MSEDDAGTGADRGGTTASAGPGVGAGAGAGAGAAATPPVARRVPTRRSHHGDVVVDDYEWLRDAADPAVTAHLEAENAWAASATEHLAALRERLFDETRARTQESDVSVPAREGAWWYYRRTVEGGQHALTCRVPAAPDDRASGAASSGAASSEAVPSDAGWEPPALPEDGGPLPDEQVMLDGNALAAGHPFFALGAASVSPDGALLAWSQDVVGDERFTLRVRDLATGEDLADEIAAAGYGATWAADSRTLLYTVVDQAWRPHEVRRHTVGTPVSSDAVVLREDDERFWLGVGRTRSGRHLVITAGSKTTAEVWLLDAARPDGAPRSVAGRRTGVDYQVEHAVLGGRDALLVLHDDGAVDFELSLLSAQADGGYGDPATAPQRWTTLVAHQAGRRLEDVDAFAGHLALSYRRDALPRVAVMALSADGGVGPPREVEGPSALGVTAVGTNRVFETPVLRLGQTSFVLPATVVDLGVASGALTVRRTTPVPGYDASLYTEERTWATAADGTAVPVSVVARVGTPRDGTAPGELYAYGSYEHSIDPSFSASRVSLLDRGVVFAVAHVRGGGEMGRSWYEDGKRLAKVNTFTDLVAAAEHLGADGWVDPARLVLSGRSAGGLAVGTALNLAPHLFAGVAAGVPFVDPLTTMLDESLPLTVTEQEEWGDPIRDAGVYALMKGYSPYENLPGSDGAATPQRLPAVLVTTSLHDTRVLSVEPAKWVARMRELWPGAAPATLLKTEMDGGHGGRSGRYERWRELAYENAWTLDVLGLADRG